MKATAITAIITAAALIGLAALAQADTELYSLAESNAGKSAPWSGKDLKVKLAPGAGGELKFKLGELPAHEFLKLQLELQIGGGGMGFSNIIINGINANGGSKESEERLQITTATGQTLLDSSFSSMHLAQSFPDAFGGFNHAPGTGAEGAEKAGKNNPLVQVLGAGAGSSGVYKLELLFPHDADALELDFDWLKPDAAANPLQGVFIQMAGGMLGENPPAYTITDLTLTAIENNAAPALDQESATALLDAIASDQPKAAHAALQKVIAAGDSALPFIRARFAIKPDPDLEKKFKSVAESLRSDAFRERAKAEADLIGMGPEVLPHVIAALGGEGAEPLTADYRLGLEKVKKKLQASARASSDQALANRLHHALALSKSEEAKKTLASLPPVKKLTPYVTPDKPNGFDGADFEGLNFEFDLDE